MVVLEVRLFIGLEITGTDEDARVAEGLFGGHTNEEDFFFLFLLVVVFVRGKRTILSIFFFRTGLGGGAMVKGIVEVGFVVVLVVLVLVLRAIFSAMCTCRTASLMML